MKTLAAVLYELNQPLRIEELQIPRLKEGQVLVEVAYSGVCHSQLMEVRGKRGSDNYLPHLLGHEGTGQVVEVNKSVTKVKEKDWVVMGWIKGKGLDAGGSKYEGKNGIVNSGAVTTLSTYTVVSENRLVKLPPNIPKDIGVMFGCAVPTGAGLLFNEVKPTKGSSMAFFGLGGIGLCALMSANSFECSPVIAIDIVEEKLELAKLLGATHTINPINTDPVEAINCITNGKGVDFSIEAAGNVETIEIAFASLKRDGICVFASHPEAGKKICIDPFDLICGKKIHGSWGGSCVPDIDIPKFASFYTKGSMPLEKMLKQRYLLENINNALEDLEKHHAFRPLVEIKIENNE